MRVERNIVVRWWGTGDCLPEWGVDDERSAIDSPPDTTSVEGGLLVPRLRCGCDRGRTASKISHISFDDIQGVDSARADVEEVVHMFRRREIYPLM